MQLIKKIWFKFQVWKAGSYNLAKVYHKYLSVEFGKNVRITGKDTNFGSEPYLIRIGSNVTITGGVIFETHDGGVGLFREEFPGINVFGRILVGNNVFIGHHAIIMPGVTIGDNVVIGAGSIVTRDIPAGVVAVGVPAKSVKSISEYKEKILKHAVMIEAKGEKQRKIEILKKLGKNN